MGGPVKGTRYKCSVCKDFDYCGACEERMEHPHPFLKIRSPAENPVVMMTILKEKFKEMIPKRGGQCGPKGNHGHRRGGCGGHGRHGGPRKWLKILRQFMKNKNVTAEELHEMATSGGVNVPLDVIKEKMGKLDQLSEDENEDNEEMKQEETKQEEPSSAGACGMGGFGCGRGGGWKAMLKAFMGA